MNKDAKYKRDRRKFQYQLKNLYWKRNKQWSLQFQKYDDEIFREIPDYLGYYFISNYGRVISFSKSQPHELKTLFKNGSVTIGLSRDREREEYNIQDLVYICFRGPMPLKSKVEHINGNPRDNYYKNLRLFNPEQRSSPESISKKEDAGSRPGHFHHRCKEVLQFDLKGNYLQKFPSIKAAAASVNGNPGAISQCLQKNSHTSAGFQWRFRFDPLFRNGICNIAPLPRVSGHQRPGVLQFDLNGKFIREFPHVNDAAKAVGVYHSGIRKCLSGRNRKCRGFQWRSINDPRFKNGIIDIPPLRYPAKKNYRAVLKFNRMGRLMAEYSSITEAAKENSISIFILGRFLKGHIPETAEFYWEFKEDHDKKSARKPSRSGKKKSKR
jgi:hypothetical protein